MSTLKAELASVQQVLQALLEAQTAKGGGAAATSGTTAADRAPFAPSTPPKLHIPPAQRSLFPASGTAGRMLAAPLPKPSPAGGMAGATPALHAAASGTNTTAVNGFISFKVRPPERLQAAKAASDTVLEDWIFELESCLVASGVSQQGFEVQMAQTRACWDRDVNTWWNGAQEEAQMAGKPILTWDAFLEAIRANYTPGGDVEKARRELMAVRQPDDEAMDAYVTRVQALFNRVPRTIVPSQVAAMLLLDGIDQQRFPQSWSAMMEREQEARAKPPYRGLSFEQLRALLPSVAAREPRQSATVKTIAGVQGSKVQPATGHKQTSTGGGKPESGADMNISVICYRCKEEGHFARDCAGSDKRTCGKCGKGGHTTGNCRSGGLNRSAEGAAPGGARADSRDD